MEIQKQVSYDCRHLQKSARPEITKMLSEHLEKQINVNDTRVYWAKEVTFGYGTAHARRVDYMRFVPKNNSVSGIEKGDFYCYEIKSSVEDFHSKNGHNFLGDYNYYVMMKDVYDIVKDEIPYHIGVYIPHGDGVKSIKMAKRKDRDRSVGEMLLMMFRSAARERGNNDKIIDKQPIIYDIDKIVDQLEEEQELAYADFERYAEEVDPCFDSECDDFFHKGMERAIKVLKGGGQS